MRQDRGYLRQRDRADAAAIGSSRQIERDPGDRLGIATQIFGEPQHDVIELLPFHHLRKSPAADRHLHDTFNVVYVEPVASAGLAVDCDLKIRSPKHAEQPHVFDAGNTLQHAGDPISHRFKLGQIVAEKLDRVGPLHPRERLFHIVADEL